MVESEREQPPPDPSIHPAKDTNSALVHVGTHLGDTAQQLGSPDCLLGRNKEIYVSLRNLLQLLCEVLGTGRAGLATTL